MILSNFEISERGLIATCEPWWLSHRQHGAVLEHEHAGVSCIGTGPAFQLWAVQFYAHYVTFYAIVSHSYNNGNNRTTLKITKLRRVQHLELAHTVCLIHVAHQYVSHYKASSTPSNKMVPKYYFLFLEPIPPKSESATSYYNHFWWLCCRWISDTHEKHCAGNWFGMKAILFHLDIKSTGSCINDFLWKILSTNERFHKFGQCWRFSTRLLSGNIQSLGKPWLPWTHKVPDTLNSV